MLHPAHLSCHKHLIGSLCCWCSCQHECCRCGPQRNLQHRVAVCEVSSKYAREHIWPQLKTLLLQDAACLVQRMC